MGTIEISDLFSYVVPLLVLYNAWLHRQVINAQIDIAVNNSKDEEIIKQFDLLKIKLDKFIDEFHQFLVLEAKKEKK